MLRGAGVEEPGEVIAGQAVLLGILLGSLLQGVFLLLAELAFLHIFPGLICRPPTGVTQDPSIAKASRKP